MAKASEPSKTYVIFRKVRDGDRNVIALFPHLPSMEDYTLAFTHIGQHFAVRPRLCVKATDPATPAEYAELKAELEQRGYTLDVHSRLPKAWKVT